jgi:glycosyltransferase involved in cell wall biosynthesis
MISFTALILTYNEEANISRTLAALSWVKEVLIVDSGSTDRTVELAKAAHPNVCVVHRPFDSHTQQWNFGLDQVTTEWVLTLDADYEVSPQLAAEIIALEPSPDHIGYWAEFEYRIYGHPLRASSYPPRIVLFKPSHARYVDDGHTQTLWIKELESGEVLPPRKFEDGKLAASPTTGSREQRTEDGPEQGAGSREQGARIGKLFGKIYHDDRKPLSRWIQEQDRYSRIEARHLLSKPLSTLTAQDRLRRKIFFAAPVMFLYLLFVRGLILDGWPGWFYVAQRTIAELLLSLRLLTEREKVEIEVRS